MSRWIIIAFGVAVWSLATADRLGGDLWRSSCWRAFCGYGEAAYGPASATIISDMYPIERRGQVLAWFFAAIPVGSALGYVFGGMIGAAHGWRAPFIWAANPGMILAVMCLFFKDPRGQGREAEARFTQGLPRPPENPVLRA